MAARRQGASTGGAPQASSDHDAAPRLGPPRVSVVIPTYRRAEYLGDAVASVLRQSRPADEIIVVADGPDPAAAAVAAAHPGVRYLEIEHVGVAGARNAGVEAATGDWVAFLDDDNLYHPDFLAELGSYLAAHPDARAVNSAYWLFTESPGEPGGLVGRTLDELLAAAPAAIPRPDMDYMRIEGRSYAALLTGLRGNMSSAAVRRDVLRGAGGFPIGFAAAEDWTMFVNVARTTEWRLLEPRLVFMRDHATSNTASGGSRNLVHTLEAYRRVWADRSRPVPAHPSLDAYRWDYRYMLRVGLAAALAERDVRAYRTMLRTARALLPRRLDRIRAMVPNRILGRS